MKTLKLRIQLASFDAMCRVIGAGVVRRFYRRYERYIVKGSGLLFMGFSLQALWHSVPGLVGWRRV